MPAEKVGRQSIFNCSRTRPCANSGVHHALQFIAAVWGKAAQDAADGHAVEKQALNQAVERWKTEREALYQRLMELDEEHDKLAKEHEAALEEIERLKAENKHLEGERDALQITESRFRAIEEALEKRKNQESVPKSKLEAIWMICLTSQIQART